MTSDKYANSLNMVIFQSLNKIQFNAQIDVSEEKSSKIMDNNEMETWTRYFYKVGCGFSSDPLLFHMLPPKLLSVFQLFT